MDRAPRMANVEYGARDGCAQRSDSDSVPPRDGDGGGVCVGESDATGLVISDADFAKIKLELDPFHGEWNYSLRPS